MLGICKICGKEFSYFPSESSGKYCSQDCYKKSRNPRVECTCKMCGKIFYRKPSLIKHSLYCSNVCRARSKENKVEIKCFVCGKKFSIRKSIASNYNIRCCSKKCSGILRRRREKRICKACGNEFEIKMFSAHRNNPRGQYCSKECYTHHSRGSNSHMWKGGISYEPYCEKFNNDLKERVRAFFSYRCLECGSDGNGIRLAVHHVNFNKGTCCDNDRKLFVPLCSKCHGKTNRNREYWTQHFTEIIDTLYAGKCYFTKEEMAGITPATR